MQVSIPELKAKMTEVLINKGYAEEDIPFVGEITREGKEAYSVKAFGDYKGYALVLMIEVMTGSLVGVPMMIESTAGSTFAGKLPRRGAVIMAFDPANVIDPEEFKKQNSELLANVQKSQALPN
jgi:LDH2 family malate/lactate/ureidoglycolate dehydrogenase